MASRPPADPYEAALRALPGATEREGAGISLALRAQMLRLTVELSQNAGLTDDATAKQAIKQLEALAAAVDSLEAALAGLSIKAQEAATKARERSGARWTVSFPGALRLLIEEHFPDLAEIVRAAARDLAAVKGRSRGDLPDDRKLAVALACAETYRQVTGRQPRLTKPTENSRNPHWYGHFSALVEAVFRTEGIDGSASYYASKVVNSLRAAES